MTTMTAPGSDALFAAAANPPTTPEGWDAVRKGALLLAESGRLLLTGDRVKETDTWLEQARALVAEADAARALAESKDQEGIEAAGDRVYATCEACHARHVGN
jgi:cytochrome c5